MRQPVTAALTAGLLALATLAACSGEGTLETTRDQGDDPAADDADAADGAPDVDVAPDGGADLDGGDVPGDTPPGDLGDDAPDGPPDAVRAGPFSLSGTVVNAGETALTITLAGGQDVSLERALGLDETAFTFEDALFEGDDYTIGVSEQPEDRNCWAGNGTGVMPAGDVTGIRIVCMGPVAPSHPDLAHDWLDFNVFPVGAAPAPCAGTGRYVDCVHSGEWREVAVPGLDDCTGVTAADDAEAFVWACDDSAETPVVRSVGLDGEHGLLDLLDFGAAPTWRELSVEVAVDDVPYARAQVSTWWANPVVAATATDGVITLTEPGTIAVVTGDTAARPAFTADRVALVIAPGATLSAPDDGDSVIALVEAHRFGWLEGDLDATGNDHGLRYAGARHTVVRNARIRGAADVGLLIESGTGGLFADVEVAESGADGVRVANSGNWLFRIDTHDNGQSDATGAGLVVGPSIFNTLTFVRAHANAGAGIVLDGAYFMPLSVDLRAYSNGGSGIVLTGTNAGGLASLLNLWSVNNEGDGVRFEDGSVLAHLANVVSASNGGAGIVFDGGTQHRLATVLVTHNQGAGVRFNESDGNRLADVTIASNLGVGLDFNDSNDNQAHQALVAANGNVGVRLRLSTHNVLSNVAVAGHGTEIALDNNEIGFTHAPNLWVGGLLLDEADCELDGDLVYGLDADCGSTRTEEGAPAFELTLGLSLDGLFRGAVPADEGGQAAHDDIADWTALDGPFESFGNDGTFGGTALDKGRCSAGTCQVWDWRLAGDGSGAFDALGQPDGEVAADWLVDYVTSTDATGRFARSLVEFPGDGAGNDDLLCQPGECCLFTPNVGADQGTGSLIVLGDFEDPDGGEAIVMYAYDGDEGDAMPAPPCRFAD